MSNQTKTSLGYHRQTEYSRFEMAGHSLDWANQPAVFKTYPGIEKIPLFKEDLPENHDLWQMSGYPAEDVHSTLTFQAISRILRLTTMLTAVARHPGQDFYYRSAASAGALYPNEIYLAHEGISDLASGLYHYGIQSQALQLLRQETIMPAILSATDGNSRDDTAASILISGIFFRSSWKYRARAYRYVLLDAGHVLENLILALRCMAIPCSLHVRFDDKSIDHILGINGTQEACIVIVNLHGNPVSDRCAEPGRIAPLPEEILQASLVSQKEVSYPEILDIHQAGMNLSRDSISVNPAGHDLAVSITQWQDIPQEPSGVQAISYPEILFQRRSKRNFIPRNILQKDFQALLNLVCSSAEIVDRQAEDRACLKIGFLAERVEGVTPGFYLLDSRQRRIGLVETGSLNFLMTDACLNQEWLANAAVHFLFLANLPFLDQAWGARGYRHAMIKAGRIGQMIYLGAAALNMGACGIGAFYDDEARAILGLDSESALLYLVAAGPVKRM